MTPPPEISAPTAAIAGSTQRFPVRRILCIGRNYAAHAREMGASGREAPFFFSKSTASLLVAEGETTLRFPPRTSDLHHELELVVALGAGGANLAVADAPACVWGYALGLDMTRRDVQAAAKAEGKPWTAGKDFDHSAVLGPIVPKADLDRAGGLATGPLALDVNGAARQRGDTTEMIWGVDELIAELSTWMRLEAGDLIYTGTPSGVGPVRPGDVLVGRFPGLPELTVRVG